MSDMTWLPKTNPARRSLWRWYPWALAGAMLLVFAVNAGMVFYALHTFPGAARGDGFDESNGYDRILAAVARQDALGWSAAASATEGVAVLRLTDRQGRAVTGLAVAATALRPLGPPMATDLAFRESADGRYLAAEPLPAKGQWDLMLRVGTGDRQLHVTRRILVR